MPWPKGRPRSAETREKIAAGLRGHRPWGLKKYSPEQRKRCSHPAWNKGKKTGPSWNKGQSPSEQTRAKISASCKKLVGEKACRWKGGRLLQHGYCRVWTPTGRRLEHRVVMEQYLGRSLLRSEVVHHKNHDRSDNRIENLELVSSQSEHMRMHHMARD